MKTKPASGPGPSAACETLTARQQADCLLEVGCVTLIGAFNLCNEPTRPWGFPSQTGDKVHALLKEIYALFQLGGFEEHLSSMAQGDVQFQRFLKNIQPPQEASQ
jgi:hypothetical protein